MSYITTFNGDHKVLKCTGIPRRCEDCWNNPCRLKQAFDIRTSTKGASPEMPSENLCTDCIYDATCKKFIHGAATVCLGQITYKTAWQKEHPDGFHWDKGAAPR